MSDKKETSSQQNITKQDVRKAVKAAPNVVKPNHVGTYTTTTVQGLGACVTVVAVPSVGNPTQMVIHRPIGKTDLRDDDWVISMYHDIDALIVRAKDPNENKIREKRSANRSKFLTSKGLLEEKDGKFWYPGLGSATRNEFLDNADRELALAKKEKKAPANAKRADYLPDKAKEAESRIAEVLKTDEGKAAIEDGVNDTYRTRGGPLEDINQEAIPGLTGKTIPEILAILPRLMIEGIGRGKVVHVTERVEVTKEVPKGYSEEQVKERISDALASELEYINVKVNESMLSLVTFFQTVDKMKISGEITEKGLDDMIEAIQSAANTMEDIINGVKPESEGGD